MSDNWPTAFITIKYSASNSTSTNTSTCTSTESCTKLPNLDGLADEVSKLLHGLYQLPNNPFDDNCRLVAITQPISTPGSCGANVLKFCDVPNPYPRFPDDCYPVVVIHVRAPRHSGGSGLSEDDVKLIVTKIIDMITTTFHVDQKYIFVEHTEYCDTSEYYQDDGSKFSQQLNNVTSRLSHIERSLGKPQMDQQTSQSIDVVSSDDNKWPTAFFTLKCSKKVSSATRLGEQLAALLHDFPQIQPLQGYCRLAGVTQLLNACYASFPKSTSSTNPYNDKGPIPIVMLNIAAPRLKGRYGLSDDDVDYIVSAIKKLLGSSLYNVDDETIYIEPVQFFDFDDSFFPQDKPLSDGVLSLLRKLESETSLERELSSTKAELEIAENKHMKQEIAHQSAVRELQNKLMLTNVELEKKCRELETTKAELQRIKQIEEIDYEDTVKSKTGFTEDTNKLSNTTKKTIESKPKELESLSSTSLLSETEEQPKKKEDTRTSSVEKESNRKSRRKTKRKSGHH